MGIGLGLGLGLGLRAWRLLPVLGRLDRVLLVLGHEGVGLVARLVRVGVRVRVRARVRVRVRARVRVRVRV